VGSDVLVLNAGHRAREPAARARRAAALRRVVDVNFHGYFNVLQAAGALDEAAGPRRQRHRQLVEERVRARGPTSGAYSASKAAGHQLAKVAAMELAPVGIRVNLINADAVFGNAARPSDSGRRWGRRAPSREGSIPPSCRTSTGQRNLLKATVTPGARRQRGGVLRHQSDPHYRSDSAGRWWCRGGVSAMTTPLRCAPGGSAREHRDHH
jgi:NAD(P)-dependent dehydrogenase (short-subunit alcohol dehydrogenase family)